MRTAPAAAAACLEMDKARTRAAARAHASRGAGPSLLALGQDLVHAIAPYCARSDLGRLLRTCRWLRVAGSCDSRFLWRVWTASARPPAQCAALRSSIVHQRREITRCMLAELRESGCDMSSLIALPRDAGCALFASALHVGDVAGARGLLELVHADDLFEALLLSIERADPITVHYILRDIVDALDLAQCEHLREAAYGVIAQDVECEVLYSMMRRVQTYHVVLDALCL